MQTRIGNPSSKTIHGPTGRRKGHLQIALFSLILLCRCSTFTHHSNLRENLQKLCLSGEGRGILGISSKKFGFDFESLIVERKWALDFHFPAGMEKIIEIDYSNRSGQQRNALRKLLKELNPNEAESFLAEIFWENMIKILLEKDSINPNLIWHWNKDRFIIIFPPRINYSFRLEASQLDSYFKRIQISVSRDKGMRGPALQLELFLSDCSAKL